MKENLTEIVFLLDRSGSMGNVATDTIGGFNSFIQTQKEQEGEALLTTVLFDDECEILHLGENINDISELTREEYFARGCTALLDAIGETINSVGARLNSTKEEERPSKILFIITTDGLENASKVYSASQIKEMIEHQTNKYSWEFMFLGANIDAFAMAESYGIPMANATNYTSNSVGVDSVFTTMGEVASVYRSSNKIDENWNKKIR